MTCLLTYKSFDKRNKRNELGHAQAHHDAKHGNVVEKPIRATVGGKYIASQHNYLQ